MDVKPADVLRMMHHQPTTTAIQWSEDGTDVVVPRAGDVSSLCLVSR